MECVGMKPGLGCNWCRAFGSVDASKNPRSIALSSPFGFYQIGAANPERVSEIRTRKDLLMT